eukprot:jgi/Picre1/34592/NNA_002060.t1
MKNTVNNAAVLEERTRSDGGFEVSVKNVGPLPHVHFLRHRPFAAIIPGDGVAEQVITTGLNQFLSLYNAALIGRLVLTWFPNPPQVIVTPLATICDPYLNLFRGIIPPLGGTIDLSPILAFVVLDLFTNSAAALPAEMDMVENNNKVHTTSRRQTQAKAWWAKVMSHREC